eukprot:1782517-Amphidinium_carterae.1
MNESSLGRTTTDPSGVKASFVRAEKRGVNFLFLCGCSAPITKETGKGLLCGDEVAVAKAAAKK